MSNIVLSYSLIKKMLQCEMQAYWGHIRGLEKKQWKRVFWEGNLFQYGIYRLMQGKKIDEVEKLVSKMMKDLVSQARKNLRVSPQDEQEFVEIGSSIVGMLRGYANRYKLDLKVEKHIANEVSIIYPVGKYQFGVQMDNIIEAKGKWYLHEGKAWASLRYDMAETVKKNLQIATYFHMHNHFYKKIEIPGIKKVKPFSGIIFDAVQKPKIRQKGGETYRGYLKRLEAHYSGAEANNKFFKEVISEPGIKWEHLLETIDECTKRFIQLKQGRAPMRSFSDCHWCDFYDLCFNGENKKSMLMYRPSEYMQRYKGGKK